MKQVITSGKKKIFFIDSFTKELILNDGKPTGGASVQTLVWIKAFFELGYSVYLSNYLDDNRIVKQNFSWIELVPLYHNKRKRFLVWFTYRLPKIFQTLQILKCDYVYTSIPTWQSFYIGLICRVLKIKHIIRIASDINADDRLGPNQTKIDKFFIFLSYKISNLIITQNEYQYNKLKNRINTSNIIKISNPIVIDYSYPNPKKKMEGYIAWVANFRRVKNLGRLFEIARILPNEKFKIAGDTLVTLDLETEKAVSNLNKLPNVEFCGNISRESIRQFYEKSKFLLNTSDFEGFSNTFLEAMITGTPIITTSKVNPDGIISNFQLGIIYKSPSNLRDMFLRLEESKYQKYSTNCLNYVINNHDHLILGKKLISVINSIP
ncbi:glycosyltransferase [Cognataquiflexum rubidum]|uniref:glycosyltransferase n=1 Tax=Cognataquiflexum rubidum TaxID=2922273 RepID=UPI001F13CDAB|nr:glycosyltransferase [Cognataquiflexum rubidum]MCH6236484.1 glycosyltransferase [Cognataquiflexum rubidum]